MAVDPKLLTVNYALDDDLKDFTKITLQERYMVPGEASPQDAFARACAAFADDLDHAQRLYSYISKGWFMFATPLLANGGTTRGLPISCFLTSVEDSRTGISEHYDEVIWLASMGGGIGTYWGGIRSDGEETSAGSRSTGANPFICVDDRLILAVSQGTTRRGSNAAYMDIHHPEIEQFIKIRSVGGDENRKAFNLHNAVMITDEFMKAVRDDADFHLRSPKDGSVRKTVRARTLWDSMIETRLATGEPYMVFTDTINRALPQAQKDLGLKVRQSNLCVTGDTQLLTSGGYASIGALFEMGMTKVDVWNGEAWSEVEVFKTAEKADVIRVWMEDGDYLDCTPAHKFHLKDGSVVAAVDLEDGDELLFGHNDHPSIDHELQVAVEPDLAYVAGWSTFAGFRDEDSNRLAVSAPGDLEPAVLKRLLSLSVDALQDEAGVWTIRFEPQSIPAGFAPFFWNYAARRNWLAGVMDAVGQWVDLGEDGRWLTMGSTDVDMIRDLRLLALSCGLSARIRIDDGMCVFSIDERAVNRLATSGLSRFQVPVFTDGPFAGTVKVSQINPLPWTTDVFCVTEPAAGRMTVNGYVVGNCTEITLVTGIDHLGKRRTAVCCLSSVNAETFNEWVDDPRFIEDLLRMLDNVLQVFIDTAPQPEMSAAVYSATQERAVGLGCLGFQAFLQKAGVSMEDEKAGLINQTIFRHLRASADKASLVLGAERGEAPDMAGTGERFSHKLAVAPNASSSILCRGTSPSIEPHRANAYLHKTLSGSFPVRNPYLEAELEKRGLNTEAVWGTIVANEGSCQHIEELPADVRAVYKTATEIDQRVLVRLAAERQKHLCQAQSLNLFFPHDADAEYIYETHFMAWELGCKSLYYLRSTTPHRAENTNTKVERTATPTVEAKGEEEECFSCQG